MEKDLTVQPTGLAPGSLVADRYRIEKLLGEGGMGEVYLAIDELLSSDEEENRVALKILRPDFCKEERHRKRFLREVQLTRSITHPNVVRTFEVGTHNNLLFFTMEYVRGEPLCDKMTGDPLEFGAAISILVQAVKGLIAIHDANIVHRDLKPANLMITRNGEVKITDFGIARGVVSDLTSQQEVLGSAFYMSPEMWLGDDITTRSDVYSFGVLAYEILTGVVPFDGAAAPEVMCKHLELAPVPPLSLTAGIPAWCSDLIVSMLAKSPKRRPSSEAVLRAFETNLDASLNRSSVDGVAIEDLMHSVVAEGDEDYETEASQPLPQRQYVDQRRILAMDKQSAAEPGGVVKFGVAIIRFCAACCFVLGAGWLLLKGLASLADGIWLKSTADAGWMFGLRIFAVGVCYCVLIPIFLLPAFAVVRPLRSAVWMYGAVVFRIMFLMIFACGFFGLTQRWGPWREAKPMSERAAMVMSLERSMEHSLAATMFLPQFDFATFEQTEQKAKVPRAQSKVSALDRYFYFGFLAVFLAMLAGVITREEYAEPGFKLYARVFFSVAVVPMAIGWGLFAKVLTLDPAFAAFTLRFGPMGQDIHQYHLAWAVVYGCWIALVSCFLSSTKKRRFPPEKHS